MVWFTLKLMVHDPLMGQAAPNNPQHTNCRNEWPEWGLSNDIWNAFTL